MKLKQMMYLWQKKQKFEEKSLLQPLTTEPTGGTVAESVDGFMPYVEQLIFEKVNQEREKVGLSPLENRSDHGSICSNKITRYG